MQALADEARQAARRIGEAYRVVFDLGATSDSPPAVMHPRLRAALRARLERPFEMPSGAGHDAAVFAKMGVPTGMIFVRNDHGSHNSEEAMTLTILASRTPGVARRPAGLPPAMTLLVTGATGFVMSVLGRQWLDAHPDERLVVLDAAAPDEAARRYFSSVAERMRIVVADVTRAGRMAHGDRQRHHPHRARRHRDAAIARYGGGSAA